MIANSTQNPRAIYADDINKSTSMYCKPFHPRISARLLVENLQVNEVVSISQLGWYAPGGTQYRQILQRPARQHAVQICVGSRLASRDSSQRIHCNNTTQEHRVSQEK